MQNPLNVSSETMLGVNRATTDYDASWLLNHGSFHFDIAQHVETFRVFATSQGHLLITPDVDLTMTMLGSLDYSSVPGDLAVVDFEFRVRDPTDPFAIIYDADFQGGNLVLEPASGTLAFADEIVLSAGTTWRIDYRAKTDNTAEPSPAGPIDIGGFIHFEFSPVPEPSTLTLAGLGICLLARRLSHR